MEVVGARGVGIGGQGLRGELLAPFNVPRHHELLSHAQPLLRLPPRGADGGRIHWVGRGWWNGGFLAGILVDRCKQLSGRSNVFTLRR